MAIEQMIYIFKQNKKLKQLKVYYKKKILKFQSGGKLLKNENI